MISLTKPTLRWLFGGVGFHNSEATMTPIMSKKFKEQVVLKVFREISPTYSRVFAGYANWSKEAMDSFADYYDETFRKAGTLVYAVPGRMPYITDDFDIEDYCEKVASNLEYLIKERNCTKIRYYCVTNELSVGNTYAYLSKHLDLLKTLHEGLYKAFRRHNLDIGLLATDCSGVEQFGQIDWAAENMDEVTECYCAHLYSNKYLPGDINAYKYYVESFTPPVMTAHAKEKRFVLGEYGLTMQNRFNKFPMRNDVSYPVDMPETDSIYAISLCEMAMAAINCGSLAAVMWTLYDYPDPFIRENGDTPEEKARYDVARFSGHGLDIRYNKNGIIKWCDEDKDYTARSSLYTMGYMAKLFKKGSRVLDTKWDDETIRCCGVTNSDGSVSVAIINWSEDAVSTDLNMDFEISKPMRRYEYMADNVPLNKFNDLQDYTAVISLAKGANTITMPAKSITFFTTDYKDRTPSKIKNIRAKDGVLTWDKCTDEEHTYYRVYASDSKDFEICIENQIASTVAESVAIDGKHKYFKVISVDKWGNAGK